MRNPHTESSHPNSHMCRFCPKNGKRPYFELAGWTACPTPKTLHDKGKGAFEVKDAVEYSSPN